MNMFRRREQPPAEPEEPVVKRGASRRLPEPEAEPARRRLKLKLPAVKLSPVLDSPWTFPALKLGSLVVFIAGILQLIPVTIGWLDQPVTQIRVEGVVKHLEKDELADNIASTLDTGLLKTDVEAVRDQVISHPWVSNAAITMDWPQALVIEVQEEVPVARWGENGLLNHEGEIFWPRLKQEYAKLPRLSGSSDNTVEVMAQFHDLNQIFRRVGLRVVALDLEGRGAWSLRLDNGIRVVVGRDSVDQRLERFIDLYVRVLAARADEIEQVDIRYANGVSVRWKDGANEQSAG